MDEFEVPFREVLHQEDDDDDGGRHYGTGDISTRDVPPATVELQEQWRRDMAAREARRVPIGFRRETAATD